MNGVMMTHSCLTTWVLMVWSSTVVVAQTTLDSFMDGNAQSQFLTMGASAHGNSYYWQEGWIILFILYVKEQSSALSRSFFSRATKKFEFRCSSPFISSFLYSFPAADQKARTGSACVRLQFSTVVLLLLDKTDLSELWFAFIAISFVQSTQERFLWPFLWTFLWPFLFVCNAQLLYFMCVGAELDAY